MIAIGNKKTGACYFNGKKVAYIYDGENMIFGESATPVQLDYDYTGTVETAVLVPGAYKLEVWGAEGGYRSSETYAGKGGYSVGTLTVQQKTTIFSRAGGSGNTGGTNGGFNGGGKRSSYNGGGGASDIRVGVDDLNHRVIVAGGGGSDGAANKKGMYGGGTTGGSTTENYGSGGFGGAQTGVSNSSWQSTNQSTDTTSSTGAYAGFGFGGNGITANSGNGGAGGGGWYGGSGSTPDSSGDDDRGGGGGSGFVWTGQNAPSGFGLTEEHYLTDAQTINGDTSFISPNGVNETGHSGNGYVRITPLITYKVTVASENTEYGTVSGGGKFYPNAQAIVIATPNRGYVFTGWYTPSGTLLSDTKEYTFTVTGNTRIIAKFRVAQQFTITVTSGQPDVGTVTGGGTYYEGEQVTVTAAVASDDYRFVNWVEDV